MSHRFVRTNGERGEIIHAAVLRTAYNHPVHPAPQTAKPASRSPVLCGCNDGSV